MSKKGAYVGANGATESSSVNVRMDATTIKIRRLRPVAIQDSIVLASGLWPRRACALVVVYELVSGS